MAGPRGNLPAGIVTLVFTDIEGSTRLLHELGEVYVDLLDEHNRRIREVVAAHGGVEVKTEGDAFFLAFTDTAAAVAACVDIQRRLAQPAWPGGAAPRVRVGIHVGPVTVIEGTDYVGLAVHEAARIAGAAHGGQVLISDNVADAVALRLPPEVFLVDLGHHLLRDFPQRRQLLQVAHPELRGDFPPLRTATLRRRGGLPAPPTTLVGRQSELNHVVRLLAGPARLVTLTGPGGAGKTRLALEAAWTTRHRYPGGAWFVDLASTVDPDDLLGAVQRTVGAGDRSEDVLDALCEHLDGAPSLVVLDNLEQLLPGVVSVARLLEGAPDLTILATSRQRLQLRAEHDVTLSGLADDSAGQLLRARAEAVGADMGTVPPGQIDDICRHLDGMPLAIELAAAQLRQRSPSTLLRELRESLTVLSESAADAPERHRAMRATIAWSWNLLDDEEQRLLASLGVIAGTADIRMVAALSHAAAIERPTEELVHSLIDKNLLRAADGKPDEPRVAIQEVIRQFAEERLSSDALASRNAVDAHSAWCRQLAAVAAPHLCGPEQGPWLDRLDLDHRNLRLALERSSGDGRLELVDDLRDWWMARGHWTEARQELATALAQDTTDGRLRGRVLAASAYFAERQGDLSAARAAVRQALEAARSEDDAALEARALNTTGDIERTSGDPEGARRSYQAARLCATAAGDHRQASVAGSNLGVLAWEVGDLQAAGQHWEAALRIQREHMGDPRAIAILTGNMGLVHRSQGRLDEAEECYFTCLAMARDLGDPIPTADALLNIGTIAKDRGDEETARRLYLEALEIYGRLGLTRSVASTLLHLALATDDLVAARRWAGDARVAADSVGDPQLRAQAEELVAAVEELVAERGAAADHIVPS